MTEKEILALAGEPVAYADPTNLLLFSKKQLERLPVVHPDEAVTEGGEFNSADVPLYTADQLLAATKPLEFERDVQKADIAFLNQQLAAAHERNNELFVSQALTNAKLAAANAEIERLKGLATTKGALWLLADQVKHLAAANAEIEHLKQLCEFHEQTRRALLEQRDAAIKSHAATEPQLEKQLAAAQAREQQYREALTKADVFIRNGIALGFIRMPDADCPDPAHETPKTIAEAPALPADTTALQAMIQKAGEVMRERAAVKAMMRSRNTAEVIRALPGVKMEDLK